MRQRAKAHIVLILTVPLMTASVAFARAPKPPAPALPAFAPLAIPAPPALPQDIPFADEVEGRHLLFDTLAAYQTVGSLMFDAHWLLANGAPGATVTPNQMGDETLRVVASQHKIALMTEVDTPGGARTIHRAVGNGVTLVATYFDQASGKPTKRSYSRLSFDDNTPLPRALSQVKVEPATRGTQFVLNGQNFPVPANTVLWSAGEETTADGVQVHVVDAVIMPNEEDHGPKRVFRYRIDGVGHRLMGFEEWKIDADHPKPARQVKHRDAKGVVTYTDIPAIPVTIGYTRETYTHVAVGDALLSAALWSQAVPAEYTEQPLPAVDLPPLPTPITGNFDPKALALLAKWRHAYWRFLSLSADITFKQHDDPRTSDSPALRRGQLDINVDYTLIERRPGRLHVTMKRVSGYALNSSRDGVAVSDGQQLVAVMDGNRQSRPLRTPDRLYETMQQAGLRDPFNSLSLLLEAPFDLNMYDKISDEGPALLDNQEPVEKIVLHRANESGQRNVDFTIELYLGTDNLPREIVTRIAAHMIGRMERDQPPIITRSTRFLNLQIDSQPLSNTFTLP